MKTQLIATTLSALVFAACGSADKAMREDDLQSNIALAHQQILNEIDIIEQSENFLNPVTLRPDGSVYYCNYADWRSGFFPGSVWYLYELTGDSALLPLAEKYTAAIEEAKTLTWHHDIGFIVNCSFGNGLRLAHPEGYREVMIEAAQSLATRFRPGAGVIQSWDVTSGWQAERGWTCPVIIDNMMNLELLFEATKLSGDSTFYRIACTHADQTLKNHFRPDGSCYHVVDYDPQTGAVLHRQTAQGYADESTWSRGQAWAIYGFTVCYRETGDARYLAQAQKTYTMMRSHKHMPADLVPYWDMDAPNIPNEPRDASSAACIASALYELSSLDIPEAASYRADADKIVASLSSPAYRAEPGTNGNFLLMHSVGSIPHNSEIDVPLNYADYYYLEALKRKNS